MLHEKKRYYSQQFKTTNDVFSVAQHYKKPIFPSSPLVAGAAVYCYGSCLGLSLSWLKSVATHEDGELFPPKKNKNGISEGLLHQHIYMYGHSPSQYYNELLQEGMLDRAKQDSMARQAQTLAKKDDAPDPDDIKNNINTSFSHYGWCVIKNEMLTPFNLLFKFSQINWYASPTLYIVATADHAGAIATHKGLLSFYDPNKGVFTYSKYEAIDNIRLLSDLNCFISGYTSNEISITQVQY